MTNVLLIQPSLCKTNPIPGGRGRDIEGLALPKAGTQTSSAHSGSGRPDWRGMGRADLETRQRVSTRRRRKSCEWLGIVASGGLRVATAERPVASESEGRRWRWEKSDETKPIAWGANRCWIVTYDERGRN